MTGFFVAAFTVLVSYTLLLVWGWHRARGQIRPSIQDSPPPISVVVAVRNEAENLLPLLDALDQQTHPSYEIVLVDDASTDGTFALLQSWVNNCSDAQLIRIEDPTPPRKKNALTQGVTAAKHDLLAFTDADCRPPPTWLSVLASTHAATQEDTILVGYSPLRGCGLLGAFAKYETLVAGTYAASAAGLDRPYMAVGRNLSYPRSVFEEVDGFSRSADSMSGDDDLFVQVAHREGAAPVRALLDERTYVPTGAPATWRTWLHQKHRHISAGRFYQWDAGFHLTLLHTSFVALWFAPLFLGGMGMGLLAVGLLTRYALLGPASNTFKAEELLSFFPFLELGYALYHILVVPVGLLFPPARWSAPPQKSTSYG